MGLGAAKPSELDRLEKASRTADQLRAAPNSAATRQFVAALGVTSKATWGWLSRFPAIKVVSKLETKLRHLAFDHRVASTDLGHLILGHSRDCRFTAGQAGGRCPTGVSPR